MSKSTDKWLGEYEGIERLVQTISQTLNERSKHPKSSTQYTKISSNVRTLLGKLSSLIVGLSRSLEESVNKISRDEYARRCGLVNELKTKEKQFERQLKDDTSYQRDLLISNSNSLWSDVNENEYTRNVESEQLLSQHDRIMQEQDRGVETLSNIVRNQKQIAITIGNEVDKQNSLIDHMDDKMDRTNERLIKETNSVKLVSRKTSTFGLWLLIILILIAIIVIVCIPKP